MNAENFLKSRILDAKNYSLLYNKQIIMNIYGLLYDKSLFNEMIEIFNRMYRTDDGSTFSDPNKFKIYLLNKILFLPLDGDLNGGLIDLCSKIDEKDIEKYIKRDTYLYNKNVEPNNQRSYISIPKIFSLLTKNPTRINDILRVIVSYWGQPTKTFITLMKGVSSALINCKKLYKQLSVNKQNLTTVNNKYLELYNKNKRVFLYVGERADGGIVNGRYDLKKGDQDVLTLDYVNIDGHVPYNNEDPEQYRNKLINHGKNQKGTDTETEPKTGADAEQNKAIEKYKFPCNKRVYEYYENNPEKNI